MVFRLFAATSLLLFPVLLPAAPDLVILVRHAEKEAAPKDDPPLTAAGRERAAELARVVAVLTAGAPLRAIFTTDYQRTRETAAPVATAAHVVPITSNDDPVAKVRAIQGGVVVIVGHSNTLPKFIEALGGTAGVVIEDAEFNHLYLLAAPGTPRAKLAAVSYGK